MKPRLLLALLALCPLSLVRAADPAPLKVLLITGGCCHDYKLQSAALEEGMKKIASATFTVINEGGTGTRGMIKLYDDPNWAKPYDVVVHNECFADTDDLAYVQKITAAHKAGGKPAVVIHCAMHSYRAAKFDDWREFLGVTSRRHDHQSQYPVIAVAKDHPALKGLPEKWTTPMDELYIIEKTWPNTKALATSVSERDGTTHPVIWTNDYHGTRIFGTTYGHSNATWRDPVFLELVARGMLWAAGRQ
jgi:uncharacterized protein